MSPRVVAATTTDADAATLRSTVGRLTRYLRLTHKNSDLSPSQREVLFSVVRHGSLRLSELAAKEGINPTMLSRIVAKLEAAQLATRTPDPVDARVVHLAATEQGVALWREIQSERTDALRFALGRLDPAQQKILHDALPVLEAIVNELKDRSE